MPALVVPNRTRVVTATTGTGTYDLGAADAYHLAPAAAGMASGARGMWLCQSADRSQWELFEGTYTAGSPDRISRDLIRRSTSGNAAVNWGSGAKFITAVVHGERLVLLDSDGALVVPAPLLGTHAARRDTVGLERIQQIVITGAAYGVTFTLDAAVREFELRWSGVQLTGDGVLACRVAQGGSIRSGASDYSSGGSYSTNGSAPASFAVTGSYWDGGVGTMLAGAAASGRATLYPGDAGSRPSWQAQAGGIRSAPYYSSGGVGGVLNYNGRAGSLEITALGLVNFAAGTFTLLGVR